MRQLPLGKLPPDLLETLLHRHRPSDPSILLGPDIGLDCAVVRSGDSLLVLKSDPITFASEDIGWYAVQVNANDIATTGTRPAWFLATILLPGSKTDEALVTSIFDQIGSACQELGILWVGGHSEVTHGLDRPILAGTMMGVTTQEALITPRGLRPGDAILLTKGIAIEGTSILAREFAPHLSGLPRGAIERAKGFLQDPGISVVPEALAAAKTGKVHAMHDPTEGGLAMGLWEFARAAGVAIEVERAKIAVLPETEALCARLDVDPMALIASGALLLGASTPDAAEVIHAIEACGVPVRAIGQAMQGSGVFWVDDDKREPMVPPARDALAEIYERIG